MASIDPIGWVATATGVGALTATQPLPNDTKTLVVFGVDVSFGAASTTAATLQIKDGTTAIWTAQLPVGATTYQRLFHRGIYLTPGNTANAVLTSAGTPTASLNMDGVSV